MRAPIPDPVLGDVNIVQNPALGAYLIWEFGNNYQEETGEPSELPLVFLVLPMLLHRPTMEAIRSTQIRSGFALFAAKLGAERENLIAVHDRVFALRSLTLQSLGIATITSLTSIDYANATMRANALADGVRNPRLPDRLRAFPNAAAKLGRWFSKVGILQVASTLRVGY